MRELRRTFAISHLPFSYELTGNFIQPFVIEKDGVTGDNISDQPAFSEARGHYWLWRNMPFAADEFVSIAQYRRSFWFPQLVPKTHRFHEVSAYFNEDAFKATLETTRQDYLEYINIIEHADRTPLNEWLRGADLVVNRSVGFTVPMFKLYANNHRKHDWDIFAQVLRKNGYNDGRFSWLTTHTVYIFTPTLFADYMNDWWKVMAEVRDLVDVDRDPYQSRKLGFMTEWFMSMWLLKRRLDHPTIRVQTLPVLEGRFENDRLAPGVM